MDPANKDGQQRKAGQPPPSFGPLPVPPARPSPPGTCVHECVYMYVHMCMSVCAYVRVCVHVCADLYECVCVCESVCTCMCRVFINVCISMCVPSICLFLRLYVCVCHSFNTRAIEFLKSTTSSRDLCLLTLQNFA